MESDPDFSWRPLDAASESTPAEPGPSPTPPPPPPTAPSGRESHSAAEQKLAPEQTRGAVALAEPPPPPPDAYGEFDADDVPPPKGKGPASTRYLGLAILVALAFVSGVAMQKHHDAGYSPPAKGLAALAGAGGAGAGRGAGAAGAAAAAAAAAGAGAGGGAAGGAGGGRAPVLQGTVMKVSGSDITVRDSSGTQHVVHTTETTRVNRQESLTDIADGSSVSVSGTPDPSGDVAATSITEHPGSAAPTTPPAGASGSTSGAAATAPSGGNTSGTSGASSGGAPGTTTTGTAPAKQ
jgi:hypothetical protein